MFILTIYVLIFVVFKAFPGNWARASKVLISMRGCVLISSSGPNKRTWLMSPSSRSSREHKQVIGYLSSFVSDCTLTYTHTCTDSYQCAQSVYNRNGYLFAFSGNDIIVAATVTHTVASRPKHAPSTSLPSLHTHTHSPTHPHPNLAPLKDGEKEVGRKRWHADCLVSVFVWFMILAGEVTVVLLEARSTLQVAD